MALNANALTTLNQAKTYIKIPLSELSQDSLVELFINAASDLLETETNRVLKAKTITEYQDGRRQNIIVTKEYPINSVDELWIDNYSKFTNPSDQVASADFDVTDEESSILYIQSSFPKGYRNIKIVYNAGYATIPADLEHACLWLVFWYAKIRNAEDIGRSSKSKEGETVSYLQAMPQEVKDCILRHKRTDFFVGNASTRNI